MNLPLAEQHLDLLSLLVLQAGVVGSGAGYGIGQSIAVLSGVRKYDGLAPVSGGRCHGLGLPGQMPEELSLLLPGGEDEMPLDGHRPHLVLHQLRSKTAGQGGGIAHSRREKYKLGPGRSVFEPRYHASQPVPTLRILKHMHLVDDHSSNPAQALLCADHLVHPLVCACYDVCVKALGDPPALSHADAADSDADGCAKAQGIVGG